MKEKRILAMFITSAITLVTSLAVTFGVLMTLADPVIATGLTRYTFSFNGTNENSLVVDDGDTLSLRNKIVFQPTKSVEWDDEKDLVLFYGKSIEDDIQYENESLASKIKTVPMKIENKFSESTVELELLVQFDTTTILGQYTFVKIWDYKNNKFIDYNNNGYIFYLDPNESVEYAIIIYADETNNISNVDIDWTNAYEEINVIISNNTPNPV